MFGAVYETTSTMYDRYNLPLINALIIETLRVGNMAPLALPYLTVNDTTLFGCRVPKDTIVFADAESIHMDPKCWENPSEFNPHPHIDDEGSRTKIISTLLEQEEGSVLANPWQKLSSSFFLSLLLQKFSFVPLKKTAVLPSYKGFISSYSFLFVTRYAP